MVGPLPPSLGYSYLLTCVHRFMHGRRQYPSLLRQWLNTWVAHFGTPSTVTTDRGRQFESNLWRAFTQLLGTKHLRTTAYHPCANGMVERFHRQLKAALKGHPHQEQWTTALPLVLLGIRTSLKEDLGCTTAELVYGTTLRLPGGFFSSPPADSSPDPRSYVTTLQSRMQVLQATLPRPVTHTSSSVSDVLKDASHVFIRHDAVRKPLQPPYDGPYRVLDRAPKYFTVEVKGRRDTVSIDRLKPAHLDTPAPHPTPQDTSQPVPTQSTSRDLIPPPTRTTRSGRHVRWPANLNDFTH